MAEQITGADLRSRALWSLWNAHLRLRTQLSSEPLGFNSLFVKTTQLFTIAVLATGFLGCTHHKDFHGLPLPRDTRNLSITILGVSVQFVAPPGWHIVQQPDSNNVVYVLSRTSTHEQPTLSVSCTRASVTPGTAQDKLHADHLHAIRSDMFPDAGFIQAGPARTASGREAWLYHYVGNDGQQLVAIIPESGFTSTISLHAQSPEDIASNRSALLTLLGSYRR